MATDALRSEASVRSETDARPDLPGALPLCVDLDDTLIRTDSLWESVLRLWRMPVVALRALLALLRRGKAGFKSVIAEALPIDPASLPYREDVLAYVKSQHAAGRQTALTTASHRITARRIADHLGIFNAVFATDGETNLSGTRKRAALESAYGVRGFDYIGDGAKDLPTYAAARSVMLVNPSPSLLAKASATGNVVQVFRESGLDLEVLARALRLHQWAKNVLLFVPLIAAHQVLDLQAWGTIAAGFVAFGLVASATYLINDLVDLQADRAHPRKRFRAVACGQISIPGAVALAAGLGLLGFALSMARLPAEFIAYLLVYVCLTLAYSLDLKRRLLVDVMTLAVLYTLRVLAGGAAIGVTVSEWLLMFSLFMFISLAFLKRVIELSDKSDGGRLAGRGYSAVDVETMRTIGVASGLLSVLVFALYINNPAVTTLYRSPQVLWLMCPLLIYWISRIWFLAARRQVHHDPVVFALLDWRSYVVGACALAVGSLATAGTAWMQG